MTDSDPSGQNAPPPANLQVTPVVSDHALIRLIGKGSSGEVWLARSVLGTYRAIKIVYAHAFKHRRPFDREFAGILKFEPVSRLHDGLVDILQVGHNEAAGYFYYVMELADDITSGPAINPETYVCRTLAHDLARHKRLPVAECVRLAAAAASALGFLHRNSLIHRDVKPSNIIFVNGFPKLADIGLVTAMAEDKAYVGTEGFIPPEGPGTVRADIYSLGKVLYEISTGNDRLQYPELPPDLGKSAEDRDLIQFNKIVLRACRNLPRDRFRTAEELMKALLAFQFDAQETRRHHRHYFWGNVIGLLGALAAASIVIAILWRLIHLLKQGQ